VTAHLKLAPEHLAAARQGLGSELEGRPWCNWTVRAGGAQRLRSTLDRGLVGARLVKDGPVLFPHPLPEVVPAHLGVGSP